MGLSAGAGSSDDGAGEPPLNFRQFCPTTSPSPTPSTSPSPTPPCGPNSLVQRRCTQPTFTKLVHEFTPSREDIEVRLCIHAATSAANVGVAQLVLETSMSESGALCTV